MSLVTALLVVSMPVAVVLALALSGRSQEPRRALLAAGAAIAVGGWIGDALELALQLDLRSWVETPAQVVLSERGERRNDWRFAYEYEFGGERYRASRLTYAPRLRSRADTDRLAETYPEGRPLVVHVDPDDPSRASVEAEPHFALPLAAFLLHALLGWVVLARLRAK
jgi:hypothetical protein